MSQPDNQQTVYYVQRQKPTSPVTITLIAVTVLAWVAGIPFPGLPDLLVLTNHWRPVEVWRLLTPALVHFGILHLALNMLALWFLGQPLELVFGKVRFLVLYLVSTLGGSALSLLLAPEDGWVAYGGASGAIFGLFGGLVVLQAYKMIQSGSLIPILLLNLGISFTLPNIGWQSHIGGLLIGSGVAWAIVRRLRRETSETGMWVEIGLITLLTIGVIVAKYVVL